MFWFGVGVGKNWCSDPIMGRWFKFWLIQSLPNHFWWSNKVSVQTLYKKQQICSELQESWKLSREIFLHTDLYNHRKHEYSFVPADFQIMTGSVIKATAVYLNLWRGHWFCLLESYSRKGQKTTDCFSSLTYFGYWSQSMTTFSKNTFSSLTKPIKYNKTFVGQFLSLFAY